MTLIVAMKTVWRVFAYLKRYPWMAVGTLSCAILGTLMIIVFPAVTKFIIDDVIVHRRRSAFCRSSASRCSPFFCRTD